MIALIIIFALCTLFLCIAFFFFILDFDSFLVFLVINLSIVCLCGDICGLSRLTLLFLLFDHFVFAIFSFCFLFFFLLNEFLPYLILFLLGAAVAEVAELEAQEDLDQPLDRLPVLLHVFGRQLVRGCLHADQDEVSACRRRLDVVVLLVDADGVLVADVGLLTALLLV